MEFVEAVRTHLELGTESDVAIDNAVTECIGKGILSDYLLAHRAEVIDMVLTEFDEEVFRNGMKQEGFQEGFDKGISQGQNALAEAIKKIHAGATMDELLKAGFDEKTVRLALECK